MGLVNPELEQIISDILESKSRLDRLENTPQPFRGDWLDYNPGKMSRTSASVITTVGIDNTVAFQIGDKIRLKQTGDSDYRYFYVIAITSTTLTLDGGDGNTLDALDIISFGMSRLASPSGHPITFSYSSSIYTFVSPATYNNDTSRFSGGTGSATIRYSMQGAKVKFSVDIGTSNMRANVITVFVTSPFKKRDESFLGQKLSGALVAGTTAAADIHTLSQWDDTSAIGSISSELSYLIGALNLGTPFSSGTWAYSGVLEVDV